MLLSQHYYPRIYALSSVAVFASTVNVITDIIVSQYRGYLSINTAFFVNVAVTAVINVTIIIVVVVIIFFASI